VFSLFNSLRSKKNEDDKEERQRKPRRRGKGLASAFILLLLITSTFSAGYASAWSLGSVVSSISSTIDKVKDTIKGAGTGAAVGAVIGAVVGSVIPGVGTALGAEVGAVIGGAIGGYLGYRHSSSSSSESGDVLNYQAAQNATAADLTNDQDVVGNTAKALDDTQQAAYKQIAELNAMLRSDLVKYDIVENGSTGDLWAEVYAPQKVYGYSAFPVQVKVYTSKSNIPFSVVHIKSVSIYLKTNDSSVQLWKRTWDYGNGSEGLNGQSIVYTTILKVPDPYASQIKQMLDSGQVNKKLILELFNNATTKPWEIFVDIKAYREIWQNDPTKTDQQSCEAAGEKWDANTSTCYEFVRNAEIDYHVQTTSAWKHVTMANDLAILNEGMYASLPVKFASTSLKSKWVLYQESFTGAVSDFIILTYANPVHVMGSTADYKFYIAPNPGYFRPLNVTLKDDFRFFTVRVQTGGSWELADTVFGKLGNLTEMGVPKELNAKYTTASDVLTYYTLGIAYFEIHRPDGITIPVWEVVWPKVSVEQNTRVVMDDTQIQQLITLVNQSAITADDLAKIKAQVQSWISGLNEKLQTAKALEQNAEAVGNKQAAAYAKKAEMAYEYAIDALNHAASSDQKQAILNWLNAAKKFEQAGDFYLNAAKKAQYGAPEQAALDAKMGDQLMSLGEQYTPHVDVLGSARNLMGYRVFGVPLWVLLILLFVLAGALVVWRTLL